MNMDFIDLGSMPHRIVAQSLVGVFLLSGVATVLCLLLRRNPQHRHLVASVTLAACLALPFVSGWAAFSDTSLVKLPWLPSQSLGEMHGESVFFTDVNLVETVVAPPAVDWSAFAMNLYLAGVALGLLKLAIGLGRARWLVKTSIAAPNQTKAILLGDRRDVRVRLTSKLASPVVTGLVRPLILFPITLVDALDVQGIRQVIAHELSHIEGRHLWHALVHRIAAIVLWPIPTVHAVRWQAMSAQEDLCDSSAIASGSPASYARILLSLSQGKPQVPNAWPICGIWSHNLALEARIKSLLDPHRKPTSAMKPITKAAVFGTTLATMLVLAGTQLAQAQDPAPPLQEVAIATSPVQEVAIAPARTREVIAVGAKQDRKARKAARLIRRGQNLGYTVTLAPAPNAQERRTKLYDPFDEQESPVPVRANDPINTTTAAPRARFLRPDAVGRTTIVAPTQGIEALPARTGTTVIAPTEVPIRRTRGIIGPITVDPPGVRGTQVEPSLAPAQTTVEGRSREGRVTIQTTSPRAGREGRAVQGTTRVAPLAGEPVQGQRGVPVLTDIPIVGEMYKVRDTGAVQQGQRLERRAVAEQDLARTRIAQGQQARAEVELARERSLQGTRKVTDRAALRELELAKTTTRRAGAVKALDEARVAELAKAQAGQNKLRKGKTTIIRNATVIIHEDGTVEIQGGNGVTVKPAKTTTKRAK